MTNHIKGEIHWFRRRKRLKSVYVYKQTSINKVLYDTNIVDVIGGIISLKKTKSAYVGRCPFCKTVTKNKKHFRVTQKYGWKCYECGKGGRTVFGFIMMYYNIPFDQALKFINNNRFKLEIERTSVSVKRPSEDEPDLPF